MYYCILNILGIYLHMYSSCLCTVLEGRECSCLCTVLEGRELGYDENQLIFLFAEVYTVIADYLYLRSGMT